MVRRFCITFLFLFRLPFNYILLPRGAISWSKNSLMYSTCSIYFLKYKFWETFKTLLSTYFSLGQRIKAGQRVAFWTKFILPHGASSKVFSAQQFSHTHTHTHAPTHTHTHPHTHTHAPTHTHTHTHPRPHTYTHTHTNKNIFVVN